MLLSKFKEPQKTGLKVLFFGEEGACNGKAVVGMDMDSTPHMKTVELHITRMVILQHGRGPT
jgi:hypothetical protein